MKVLGISAGTINGSNDAMCKEALMAAKEAGAEVEFINLHKLNIKHCTGCKACVIGLFSGRGNACVIKDDFQWLVDKMYDADGIIWAVPIFESCAPGIFHTVMDRFGPRLDRGNVMIAMKIAGHSDYQTTASVYTHIRDEMLKKSTVNMDEVFRKREE